MEGIPFHKYCNHLRYYLITPLVLSFESVRLCLILFVLCNANILLILKDPDQHQVGVFCALLVAFNNKKNIFSQRKSLRFIFYTRKLIAYTQTYMRAFYVRQRRFLLFNILLLCCCCCCIFIYIILFVKYFTQSLSLSLPSLQLLM